MTTAVYAGPKRGIDRAVLLAHGAGADLEAPALVAVAGALAERGIPSLRFNYPYRDAGRRAPDRPAVLLGATRAAAADLAGRTRLDPGRIVVGGRSMGGRYCSLVVADAEDPLPALGLLLLGYPLHPAGRPEQLRVEHLGRIRVPTMFVSGTRDALGARAALRRAARRVKGPVSWHWIETGDHSFKPLKSSGLTYDDVLRDLAAASADWVASL
ncbi:MAG: alpha/beta family hydrolase [Actinomycetes bacterium]